MPKGKRLRAGSSPAKPRKLRKQLRSAEADLAKAQDRRDQAQARVEAMSIIADELRAQLADAEAAAALDQVPSGQSTSTTLAAPVASKPVAPKPAASRRTARKAPVAKAAAKPAATPKAPVKKALVKTAPAKKAPATQS